MRLRDSGPSATPHDNESDPFTLTITVNAVNDPPVFTVGANQQIGEDSGAQTVFGFVSNIRPGPSTADDEINQSVSFSTANDNNPLFSAQPSVSANGTLTYTAAPNANGVAVVTITAQDSGSGVAPNQNTSSRTFTITVDAVNDAPTLTIPTAQSANEDISLPIPGVSLADLDAAEGTGQVEVQFRVTNGSVTLNTNVPNGVLASQVSNNNTGTVTVRATPAQINATLANATGLNYRGALNFNGQDQLVINVDALGNTGSPGARNVSRTLQITINPVNDPPFVANPVADLVVNEDSAPTLIELFPQVFNDPDVLTSGDRLTLQVVGNTNLSLVDATVSGTVLTLALLPDAFGQADIIVQATDSNGLTVQDTFRLTVPAQNDAPRPVNDAVTANSGVATVIRVLDNDLDVDSVLNPASLAIVSAPTNGTAVANANGTVTYTSTAGFSGLVTFTYVVSDDQGATSPAATVTVTVNRPPTANNDAVTTDQGEAVAIQLLANDTDADGTLVGSSVAITQQPANGTVLVNASGVATYTPNVDFSGTDTFRYTVRDNNGAVSNAATVTITVTNLAPVLTAIGNQVVNEQTELRFTATAMDNDQPLTFSLANGVAGAIPTGASITNDGIFTWTPMEGQGPGTFTFDVVVTDNGTGPLQDRETITITVNEVNVAPVLNPIGNRTVDEQTELRFTTT
ncbi:MAG TPA: Ig-like domain-containing protein, partial [Nitrospiraceae bacterium]|nr:Ig-like domain-containing protein [Nitrospiraceae bacterium]